MAAFQRDEQTSLRLHSLFAHMRHAFEDIAESIFENHSKKCIRSSVERADNCYKRLLVLASGIRCRLACDNIDDAQMMFAYLRSFQPQN